VSLSFEKKEIDQALHITINTGGVSVLCGAMLYVRDRPDQITLVHIAIDKSVAVDITIEMVLDKLKTVLKKVKGISKVHLYYTNTILKI
jgi:hypothetical protein